MGEIPTEQWAQVIEKTGGPVDYKKIPVQKPASDEVLVNIKFSGVCHTDLHAVNGDWPLVSHKNLRAADIEYTNDTNNRFRLPSSHS